METFMFYGLNLSWHWSPFTLIFIVVLCLLYGFGIRFAGRNGTEREPIRVRKVVAFVVAMISMALVLLTPFDTIARTQLFIAHMGQAVVLTTVCAPLLLLACPAWLLLPVVNLPVVRNIVRALTQPVVASAIFNVNFLVWHAPGLFKFALANGTFYHIEMLSFLLTSLLNWWPLIGPVRELRRLSYPQQMLYAFLDGQPVDIFAFLIVFSGVVFYPYYVVPSQLGISAYADQAAGGALLLLPGLVDLLVMTPLFFRWLGQLEEKARLNDERLQQLAEAEAAMAEAEEMEGEDININRA
jgi:cytochrome c oxidase assembly factor CtaG